MQTKRQTDVLNFLRFGMEMASQRLTRSTLGNRNEYIGISDLAKYSHCPRAALSSKVIPNRTDLQQMLLFARGHWMEDGIGQCLGSCGVPIIHQLEIYDRTDCVPVKAHLDFVLFSDIPQARVRIVEVKSMSTIPDTPYPQHEFQARAQVSMLYDYWSKPVFTLRDENGYTVLEGVPFPQICKANFGISLPDKPDSVSVESWLLCVSMKEAKPFGPYVFTPDTMNDLSILADEFWTSYTNLKEQPEAMDSVPYRHEYDQVCYFCQYNDNCPKFCAGDNQPQWEAAIAKMEMLKEKKSGCDEEIRELDAAIRQAYRLSGTRDWISAGKYRFRVSQVAGRKSINKGILKEELTRLFAYRNINIDVPEFLATCEREGEPYSRLNISTISEDKNA